MSECFGSKRLWRRSGEHVPERKKRFDEGANQLRDDGIAVEGLEPILGLFCLQMLALTPERCERAVAAPTQNGPVLLEVRRVCTHRFADLHHKEATARGNDAGNHTGTASTGNGASWRLKGLIAKG